MKIDLRKTLFNKTLSIEDLSYLSKLLDTNLSIVHCINLIKNKKNEKILNDISNSLNEGRMIEEAIKIYLPKQIEEYMIPLLKSVSFTEGLSLSLKFNEKQRENQNKLISKIAYPCILLFITITVLYLFDLYLNSSNDLFLFPLLSFEPNSIICFKIQSDEKYIIVPFTVSHSDKIFSFSTAGVIIILLYKYIS